MAERIERARKISIHAPTRGATQDKADLLYYQQISIHAPTRGATGAEKFGWDGMADFNPRSYKRSDLGKGTFDKKTTGISIHAPTRGATYQKWTEAVKKQFQSTLLQEERLDSSNRFWAYVYFNPRSYKRSDLFDRFKASGGFYFNPRSYKRSDYLFQTFLVSSYLFQSTLLQEERPCSRPFW